MPSSRRNHRARIFGLVSILLAGSMLIINPVNAETAARPFSVAQQDPPTDSDEPPILSDKVDADLAVALDTKGSADFYIDFADHADLAAASSIADWADRGAAVVKTLQATADASQAEVRKQLDAEQVSYTSFWIANTILVRSGSTALAQQAVERAAVEAIRPPQAYEIPEPTIGIDEQQINAVEWGIDRINADDVWSTLGVRGEGIVVGSIDTGVNFQHPALAAQYRGNSGGEINHDYNWFDPVRCVCRRDPVRQQQPRHPHDGHDGRRGRRSEQHRGRAGRTLDRRERLRNQQLLGRALLESGQWMLAPTRLDGSGADPAQRPTDHQQLLGRTGEATVGTARPSTPGVPPASSRRSLVATAAPPADRPDRPVTTSRLSRPGRSTSTTSSPRPRGGAGSAARQSPTWPRRE